MYHFAELLDCPDITLRKGQVLIMQYSYTWDTLPRTRTYRRIMPLEMHLKDLCKMREKALQMAHDREHLQGEPPKLFNMWVRIERVESTIS
jgi:hypothetical protein